MLISGLVLAFGRAGTAFNPVAAGHYQELKPWNRTSQPRLLLADRTETKDRIIYGTDPEMERATDEQQREEKEKEEKAWNMLQHMNIYKDNGKKTRPTQPGDTPTN